MTNIEQELDPPWASEPEETEESLICTRCGEIGILGLGLTHDECTRCNVGRCTDGEPGEMCFVCRAQMLHVCECGEELWIDDLPDRRVFIEGNAMAFRCRICTKLNSSTLPGAPRRTTELGALTVSEINQELVKMSVLLANLDRTIETAKEFLEAIKAKL